MSQLKIPKSRLSMFRDDLAVKLGVRNATVLEKVVWWINHNQELGYNVIDGKAWCYQSVKEWQAKTPYYSERAIAFALRDLRKSGWLVAEAKSGTTDRRLWYSLGPKAERWYNSDGDRVDGDDGNCAGIHINDSESDDGCESGCEKGEGSGCENGDFQAPENDGGACILDCQNGSNSNVTGVACSNVRESVDIQSTKYKEKETVEAPPILAPASQEAPPPPVPPRGNGNFKAPKASSNGSPAVNKQLPNKGAKGAARSQYYNESKVPEVLRTDAFRKAWFGYLKYRRQLRVKDYVESSEAVKLKQLAELCHGGSDKIAIDCIEMCLSNNWQGLPHDACRRHAAKLLGQQGHGQAAACVEMPPDTGIKAYTAEHTRICRLPTDSEEAQAIFHQEVAHFLGSSGMFQRYDAEVDRLAWRIVGQLGAAYYELRKDMKSIGVGEEFKDHSKFIGSLANWVWDYCDLIFRELEERKDASDSFKPCMLKNMLEAGGELFERYMRQWSLDVSELVRSERDVHSAPIKAAMAERAAQLKAAASKAAA